MDWRELFSCFRSTGSQVQVMFTDIPSTTFKGDQKRDGDKGHESMSGNWLEWRVSLWMELF